MTRRRFGAAAMRLTTACLLAGAASGCREGSAAPAPSDASAADAAIQKAMADPASWPSHGRDYTNQRYSPLAQIDTANVDSLQVAWTYHTGLPHAFEATPVVVDGVMYITTPLDHVVALDAANGRRLWEYTHDLQTTDHCCGPVNRGVAVYGGRVFLGTLDARLVALDAKDGHRLWDVQVGDNETGRSITAAPIAVKGMVITGISGGEYGIRGYVTAYDAATGKQIWRWYTIPSPEEGGWWGGWKTTDPFGTPVNRDIAQEKHDSAQYADAWKVGGVPMWNTPAVDLQRNLVVFSTGNVSPDVDGSVRPGDNLYGNSIVALDLTTGKLKWYMQAVPHDRWDYDLASPVTLLDVTDSSGRRVPAAAEAAKTGWVYVVNRETGAPIRRSEPFVVQKNMFTPPSALGSRVQAGAFGGSEWSPTAYSPKTGYLYVLGVQEPITYKVRHEERIPGAWWVGGAYYASRTKNQGTFSAIDASSGRVVWQQQIPEQMIGGALATAGGLVFTGTADKQVLAFDARSGKQLWTFLTNGGVNAPPMSYAVNGRQYVAVATGGNWIIDSPRDDQLVVFTLGTPMSQLPGAKPTSSQPTGRH